MTILLDTRVWLWSLSGSSKLGARAKSLIESPDNQVMVSAISVWEVTIKSQLGKLKVSGDLAKATLSQDMVFVPFTVDHALEVGKLSMTHKDPFDRALIAQAITGRMALLTADVAIRAYEGLAEILWAV